MVELIERYQIQQEIIKSFNGSTWYMHTDMCEYVYKIYDRKKSKFICTFDTGDSELNKKLANNVYNFLNNKMIKGGMK